MELPLSTVAISHEPDVVIARRRARHIAKLLKFPDQDGTRIATAVSEIARNAFAYAGGGKVDFLVERGPHSALVVRISDRGRGIRDLETILSGRYHSSTGMGLGIVGARRLMDAIEMRSTPGEGTTVVLRKYLPGDAPAITANGLAALSEELTREPQDLYAEIRQQNQELLKTLEDLRHREDDLNRLNRELEDTNRGVVALYAELDQRADQLRHADQMKSRFLSHVSHEFRTPLNSIVGLTRLLLKREVISHNEDATREINFIQQSASSLTEMVDDLLDLAKAESGKLVVKPTEFEVHTLFSALRGMMRPLAQSDAVELIFDDPASILAMNTDETMVSQILRNLLSNALKFTERGEVRVSANYSSEKDLVFFSVRDTGIGISPEYKAQVFEEFAQIDNPLQRKVKGTGLGLPLCRRLSELLGGSIRVESEAGAGSTFIAAIPRRFGAAETLLRPAAAEATPLKTLLLVDDEDVSRYLLRQLLSGSYRIVEAKGGRMGVELARELIPDLIFLDLNMPETNGFSVLAQLKASPATREIPIVVVTGQKLTPDEQAELAKNTSGFLAKGVIARAESLALDFGPPFSVHPRYPGRTGD